MTALITLSALLGAAASYPLLTRTARFDEALVDRCKMWIERISLPLALIGLVMLFVLYPGWFAATSLVGMLLAGLNLIICLLALIMPLAANSNNMVLSVGIIVFSILSNRSHFAEKLLGSTPTYSWRNVAQTTAALILVAETLLWSASIGLYPHTNPSLVAALGGERAIPTLAESLQHPKADREARQELIDLGIPVIPALLKRMPTYDLKTRRLAAEIIVELGEAPAMVEAGETGIIVLVSMLSVKESSKNADSIYEIAKMHLNKIGQPAVPQLIAALNNRNFGNTGHAKVIELLREIEGQNALPQILPAFVSWESSESTVNIVAALAKFGAPAIPQFLTAMESGDSWQRWWAKEVLVNIGQPARPFLLSKLEAPLPPPYVPVNGVAEAAIALGTMKEIKAVPLLIAKLDDIRIRGDVVWALGAIGDKRAAAPLIVLDQMQPSNAIIEALASIGGETATDYLTSVLVNTYGSSDSISGRHATVHRALQYESWGDHVKLLIQNLHSLNEKERKESVQNLCLIESPKILPILAEADASAHVKDGVCDVCQAIQKLKAKVNAQ